jgi:L-aspartate oxidase
MAETHDTADVLVVGSGIAGLAAALGAARAGAAVTLATKASRPADAASWWAQGGIAVTREDPDQFRADILAASDDTADSAAVDVLVEEATDAVHDVLVDTLGVEFDRADATSFDFGREAAHSTNRIVHVDASTGRHVHVPFVEYVDDHPNVEVREDTAALELVRHEGRVYGAVLESDGALEHHYAGATVLATGGIGDLYPQSTTPAGATGDGIGMAALAGADVTDMEYVQFHPTACPAGDETFLISEAVRGEGAVLRDGDGERFMPRYHADADLAPRDVVARAVETERAATGEVVLDVSPVDFAGEFPDLAESCADHGVDWSSGIPVAPAAHFLCGGIDVDTRGRTSLDRLYAVGECARTGVHGANRLASTSLLEGLVWGLRAGEDAAGRDAAVVDPPALRERDPELPEGFAREKFRRLRRVMGEFVGLHRDPQELDRALSVLRRLKGEVDAYTRTRTSRSLYELRAATITALLVTRQAAANDRSVGCHHLADPTAEADQTVDQPAGD